MTFDLDAIGELLRGMKDIPDYPDYKAGHDGFIYSFRRGYPYQLKPMKRKNRSGKPTYSYATVYGASGMDVKPIAWLVYRAFVGEVPNGFVVRHIDGDKDNNRPENLKLELLTPNSKLTESDVRQIRSSYASGKATVNELAEKFDLTTAGIKAILERKSWKHL